MTETMRSPGLDGCRSAKYDAKDRLDSSAVLERPDGIVAWAGGTTVNREETAEALWRWFGAGGKNTSGP